MYTVNLKNSTDRIRKRSIFSQTAKIFDPLGLLGPVIVIAKLLIQNLWKAQIDWDERIPANLHDTWVEYRNQLPLLNHIQFDRCISISNQTVWQLHGFCDASEKAYGACLYLRSTNNKGEHHVALICSKSRVDQSSQLHFPNLNYVQHFCSQIYIKAHYALSTHTDFKLETRSHV